jgi:hypothetical protein
VSDEQLIQSAIQHSYPDIYDDLSDLRKDYPGFTPEVKKWSSNLLFLMGEGKYYVTLPEEAVIVTAEGKARTSRNCLPKGAHQPLCVFTPPKTLELGIVGTVQIEEEGYPPAKAFEIEWEGNDKGEIFIKDHCFYAYKRSEEPLVLKLKAPGYRPLRIKGRYGRRLMAVTFHDNNYYSSMRIPKTLFQDSKTCAPDVRAKWPNVGGWAWKR